MAADPRLIEFARQMRREPTPAEEAFWRLLRNRRFAGWKFRRQHPLHPQHHHGVRLVQLRTGCFDALHLIHHGTVVAAFEQTLEL